LGELNTRLPQKKWKETLHFFKNSR